MLVGAWFSYHETSAFVKAASKAEGTVVDLVAVDAMRDHRRSTASRVYKPTVHFINNQGQKVTFTSSLGSNPPSYTKGQTLEVLYDPAEPQQARINELFSLWGDAIFLGGMGGIFLAMGTIVLVVIIFTFSDRNYEYLKTRGVPIQTQFQRVELNTTLSVNGVHPFVVLTEWRDPETSELHTFQSHNLWVDPSDHIPNESITVFIEKHNPAKHYVDLSFLPQPTSATR